MAKIFICTSFSSKIDEQGNVLPEHRQTIEPVLNSIKQLGHDYFCAVEDEGWKITEADPATEFKKDLQQLKSSDTMLALLEENISAGVQLEIGYMLHEMADAPSKKLVLAHPKGTKLAWSNQAISTLPGVTAVEYSSPEDIAEVLGDS